MIVLCPSRFSVGRIISLLWIWLKVIVIQYYISFFCCIKSIWKCKCICKGLVLFKIIHNLLLTSWRTYDVQIFHVFFGNEISVSWKTSSKCSTIFSIFKDVLRQNYKTYQYEKNLARFIAITYYTSPQKKCELKG